MNPSKSVLVFILLFVLIFVLVVVLILVSVLVVVLILVVVLVSVLVLVLVLVVHFFPPKARLLFHLSTFLRSILLCKLGFGIMQNFFKNFILYAKSFQ